MVCFDSIFWHAMPGLFGGFGNYFIPIFNTSIEVGYPRINSVSLLLVPLSYVLLLMSMVTSGAGLGWTLYPPLSESMGGVT